MTQDSQTESLKNLKFLTIVTHVITKLEYVNVRENIRAPSVLGVLKTIMDQTAILVIATRGEGNLKPVMPIMANVLAKLVIMD